MTTRHARWATGFAAGLLCLLAPACSRRGAQAARPAPGARPAAPRPPAAAKAAKPVPQAKARPKRTLATGQARRHPFVPVLDVSAAGGGTLGTAGALVLKGIIEGEARTAVIQEIRTTYMVREGEQVGGLQVLSIRDGEVVLGTGTRKRVLSLYDGSEE